MESLAIDSILDKWNHNPDYAIEILQDIQDRNRHLSKEVISYIADSLEIPVGKLYHLGSFFKAFTFEPRGEYIIQVCTGTACHVKGAPRLLEAFSRELKIPVDGTTSDGKFSLEGVRCVGCCAIAPVVQIGNELHGEIAPVKVGKILKKYSEV